MWSSGLCNKWKKKIKKLKEKLKAKMGNIPIQLFAHNTTCSFPCFPTFLCQFVSREVVPFKFLRLLSFTSSEVVASSSPLAHDRAKFV